MNMSEQGEKAASERDVDPSANARRDHDEDDASSEGLPSPTYALSRSVPLDLVDLAAEIQSASAMLGIVTTDKLRLIAQQIRSLQAQAQAVLEEARRDGELHRAECAFRKRPGHTYHLYRRAGGALYFSMLSVEDWRECPPDPFVGSYRLEPDMSWTPLADTQERDTSDQVLRALMEGERTK